MTFDLIKFNNQTHTAITEYLDQQVQIFNKMSNGTISMEVQPTKGDFDIKSSFEKIQNMVRRRDVNNGANAIASRRLEQLKNASVKVAAGTDELIWEAAHYNWTLQNPELASAVIGEQLAVAQMGDMLNTVLLGGVSAIGRNTDAVLTTTTPLGLRDLNRASFLFGDRSNAISAWVVHSGAMYQITDKALENAERLFTYANVNIVRDHVGRVFVITDSPALVNTDGSFNTVGLVGQGLFVRSNNDFDAVLDRGTGKENLQTKYQAEWSYNIGSYGYTWNMEAGGSAPNNTAIGTSTNWVRTATSIKDTAGVIIRHPGNTVGG